MADMQVTRFYIPVTITDAHGQEITKGTGTMAVPIAKHLAECSNDLANNYDSNDYTDLDAIMKQQVKHMMMGVEAVGDRLYGTVDLHSTGPVSEDAMTVIIPSYIFQSIENHWGETLAEDDIPCDDVTVHLQYVSKGDGYHEYHELMTREQLIQSMERTSPTLVHGPSGSIKQLREQFPQFYAVYEESVTQKKRAEIEQRARRLEYAAQLAEGTVITSIAVESGTVRASHLLYGSKSATPTDPLAAARMAARAAADLPGENAMTPAVRALHFMDGMDRYGAYKKNREVEEADRAFIESRVADGGNAAALVVDLTAGSMAVREPTGWLYVPLAQAAAAAEGEADFQQLMEQYRLPAPSSWQIHGVQMLSGEPLLTIPSSDGRHPLYHSVPGCRAVQAAATLGSVRGVVMRCYPELDTPEAEPAQQQAATLAFAQTMAATPGMASCRVYVDDRTAEKAAEQLEDDTELEMFRQLIRDVDPEACIYIFVPGSLPRSTMHGVTRDIREMCPSYVRLHSELEPPSFITQSM